MASAFTGAYSLVCYRSITIENEIFRMGVAGSLANTVVEAGFHVMDTINVRTKVSESNISSSMMVRKIYAKEGVYGFLKGFSACYYGSVVCGFLYFSLYKLFKIYFKDLFGDQYNIAWTYFMASFAAEFFTLIVYYPYDLIKCRLQSKNYVFKYRNIPHAFRKEIEQGSIINLYRGSFPFLITYCTCVSIQFTIYEFMMKNYKTTLGMEKFQENEFYYNFVASTVGGAVGSGLTNCMDVVTVNKQTDPNTVIMDLIRKERFNLFTKGLMARIFYNTFQSILFFNLVVGIGKIYNVELADD